MKTNQADALLLVFTSFFTPTPPHQKRQGKPIHRIWLHQVPRQRYAYEGVNIYAVFMYFYARCEVLRRNAPRCLL